MRVIMFQPRFHQLILDGVKTSTIRDKARCKEGDVLSLRRWTGKPYRSKQEVLMEVVCTGAIDISIDGADYEHGYLMWAYDKQARVMDENDVAVNEGFKDWPDMLAWFKQNKTLPYQGWLIQWGEK